MFVEDGRHEGLGRDGGGHGRRLGIRGYGPMTSGAIKAAYKAMKAGEKLPGNLQAIADALKPAYDEAVGDKHADPVGAMIRIHTKQTSAALRSNRDPAPLVKKGDPAVVGAYYSLDTGRVEVLTRAPST